MSFSIAGKTAIVTGGANGIGLAIGRQFAEKGAKVMFADMDEKGLAEQLGAEVYAELLPEEKVRQLDAFRSRGGVCMVGDGLNDSPSFEAALCAATPAVDRPVLPGKADFYFLGDGIAAIRRSLLAARHLRKVVRDNLIIAIAYNLGAVGLCLAGLVTPVVAAILMPASSLAVVSLTAYRLSGRRLAWMS